MIEETSTSCFESLEYEGCEIFRIFNDDQRHAMAKRWDDK